jgi:hypothetical protein
VADATQTMYVLFTCHGCGLQRVKTLVWPRAAGEDIARWMESVQAAVGKRHAYLSPNCRQGKADIAIPLPADESRGIGTSAAEPAGPLGDDFLKSKGAN